MMDKNRVGYSHKSLPDKLGLKPGLKAIAFNSPKEYNTWLQSAASLLDEGSKPPWDFVHLFVNRISDLEVALFKLRTQIHDNGVIWVSWYKKSAGKPTEITEDIIRDTCLPLGFVDIKVCAVSDDWSALKLVVRKELRKRK